MVYSSVCEDVWYPHLFLKTHRSQRIAKDAIPAKATNPHSASCFMHSRDPASRMTTDVTRQTISYEKASMVEGYGSKKYFLPHIVQCLTSENTHYTLSTISPPMPKLILLCILAFSYGVGAVLSGQIESCQG